MKRVSFIIIPSSPKKTWSRSISLTKLRIIVIFSSILLAVIIGLIYNAFRVHYEIAGYYYLKRENRKLRERIGKLNEIERRLAYIQREDKKLRKMLGIEKTPPPVDFTKVAFSYKPVQPESIQGDSTEGPFHLAVLPTTGFIITRGFSPQHQGIDLAVEEGTPAFACADGVIEKVGYDSLFGNFILIRHTPDYQTFYGHLLKSIKEKGDTVKAGDIVGFIGATGHTSGVHLHFEVLYKGKRINPQGMFLTR